MSRPKMPAPRDPVGEARSVRVSSARISGQRTCRLYETH
jgi:hypothetical protein